MLLNWTSTFRQLTLLQLLLEYKAKKEAKTNSRKIILFFVILYRQDSNIYELIEKNTAIKTTNNIKKAALHLALKQDKRKVICILLKN